MIIYAARVMRAALKSFFKLEPISKNYDYIGERSEAFPESRAKYDKR